MATRCVQCGADSEQARILRDRIQSDKRKLHTIESHMRKHDKRNPSPPDMDCPVVRDNPIFHDNPYDAMDAYIHKDSTEIKASHGRRGTGNSHRDIRSLYRECQRRINAAESLLDKASAEQSIRKEISSLRECIEICLDEIQQRHEADSKLSDILFEHLKYL